MHKSLFRHRIVIANCRKIILYSGRQTNARCAIIVRMYAIASSSIQQMHVQQPYKQYSNLKYSMSAMTTTTTTMAHTQMAQQLLGNNTIILSSTRQSRQVKCIRFQFFSMQFD